MSGLSVIPASGIFFCQAPDGFGIFRWSHAGLPLKLPRKIMDRVIPQPVGNLGKIHLIVADQLFGRFNFHLDEVVNDAATVKFPKHSGKLGTSD